MAARSQPRVLLVSPPLRGFDEADVGMATLQAILRGAGVATDTLYGTQLFPRTSTDLTLRWLYSALYFVPHLHPEVPPEACADSILERYLEDSNLGGVRLPRSEATLEKLGHDEAALRQDILADIARAGLCLEQCVARILAGNYDVIGLSCTFENQVAAALSIAARVRAARPECWIVLGGAACFGAIADALAQQFPQLDAVCHTEGDQVIVPLVEALLSAPAGERAELRDRLLSELPGLAWRGVHGARHSAAPPLLKDLDQLPEPSYDDFVSQLRVSAWGALTPKLYFETSRGCWWGEKHLCSFCGLNPAGLEYRKKSPARAVHEIRALHTRYPGVRRLHCADNILDMGYLRSVLPALAEERGLRMFWEIKSNLRPDQVAVLAAAGVDSVQPGIESFSDEILALMDKGATGLGQVEAVKQLYQAGIEIIYSVILQNPNEKAEHYRRMADLVPFIAHLPPPQLGNMTLMRFSPYFNSPDSHGIRNVRPKPYYRLLYQAPDSALSELAYHFDYDHPSLDDAELRAATTAFVERVIEWNRRWQKDQLYYLEQERDLVVIDRRGSEARSERLGGVARDVFRYLDRTRRRAQVVERFAEVDPSLLHSLLDGWLRRRWICEDPHSQRILAVVPRQPRAAGEVRPLRQSPPTPPREVELPRAQGGSRG